MVLGKSNMVKTADGAAAQRFFCPVVLTNKTTGEGGLGGRVNLSATSVHVLNFGLQINLIKYKCSLNIVTSKTTVHIN